MGDFGPDFGPGYRFEPTEVELVRYYLKRKVLGKDLKFNPIAEVDIYKFDPRDLPKQSSLGTGKHEWYFFCPRSNNRGLTKRLTGSGYWKVSGRGRDVTYEKKTVGKVKNLTFYYGKRHSEELISNWTMREYSLKDSTLEQRSIAQDTYVVCKVYQKEGSRPYKDEDWHTDEEKEEDFMNLVATASHSDRPLASDVVAHTLSSSSPLVEYTHAAPDDVDELYSKLDNFVGGNDVPFPLDGHYSEVRYEYPVGDNFVGGNDVPFPVDGHYAEVRQESTVGENVSLYVGDDHLSSKSDLEDGMDYLIEPPPTVQAGDS